MRPHIRVAGRAQGKNQVRLQLLPTKRTGSFPVRVSGAAQAGEWERLFQMEFQDKVLKCVDCGTEFVFTAGEQLFFHDKQFKNEPKRCKGCKSKRVAVLGAGSPSHSYQKTETRTNCSQCGKETTVPFRPTQGRPVLCRECFQQSRHAASA